MALQIAIQTHLIILENITPIPA